MFNVRTIIKAMGMSLYIEFAMLLIAAGVSAIYGENVNPFLTTGGITFVMGSMLYPVGADSEKRMTRRDGYVIAFLSWLVISIVGMLPFLFSGVVKDVPSAFFETVSGFTTTGATLFTNIDKLPHGILFWRSLTQWVGGLGFICFMIALLPIFGVNGMQLFSAEAAGTTYDKLHPRISVTAKKIICIYFAIMLLQVIFLCFGKMSLFDSVCTSMATLSTGGFLPHQAKIAYYHSRYIEYVTVVFMILGGTNISLLFFAVNGKVKKLIRDSEFRWYIRTLVIFTIIIFVSLLMQNSSDVEKDFRYALFQVSSFLSSTGFTNTNYLNWPLLTWGILLIAMLCGACSGSPSGGIKCIRFNVAYKIFHNEFLHIFHPNAVLPVRVNDRVLSERMKMGILYFIVLYIVVVCIGTLALLAMNIGFTESLSMVISCIGNVGQALGNVGQNGAWNNLPTAGKWVCSFLMLTGRLEIFPMILMFIPAFWKKN